jgi:predicted dehydrogenase
MRIGLVGCGKICGAYLETLRSFPSVETVICADLDAARARVTAEAFAIPRVGSAEDVIGADDVELVLNLTPPLAHADVTRAALAAGKHVYVEKPLAVGLDEGVALVREADARGLRIGCAPDTFLGCAWQTARLLLDEGAIGKPIGGRATMLTRGHESWHPDPEFFYRPGGGPLLDMGPYYLTALVFLLGPIRRVTGLAQTGAASRVVGSGPREGSRFPVETETHVIALVEHENGAVVTLTTSYDARAEESSFELWGMEGTLALADPNYFEGEIGLRGEGLGSFATVPPRAGPVGAARGFGLADLVAAHAEGRPHRANGELALHVLDAMTGILVAAREGRTVEQASRVERPRVITETEVARWRSAR